MNKGKITLIKNTERNRPYNYRPITCLPMMRKILTAQIREEIYHLLLSHGRRIERMPQVDQRYRRTTIHWSTLPQREQDKMEKASYGVDWLQKAYDIVPQSWMINCLKMYKISGEVIKFIENTIKKLERRTDHSRRKKPNRGKNPDMNLTGGYAITIIICKSDDAIRSRT